MNSVTINIDNFDLVTFINIYRLKSNSGYITKAKDRNNQDGILIFIPSNDIDKEINILED